MERYTNNKEMNALLKVAVNAGWTMPPKRKRKGGHIKLYSPNGKNIVVVSHTNKGGRGVKNARQDFIRAGLKGI